MRWISKIFSMFSGGSRTRQPASVGGPTRSHRSGGGLKGILRRFLR